MKNLVVTLKFHPISASLQSWYVQVLLKRMCETPFEFEFTQTLSTNIQQCYWSLIQLLERWFCVRYFVKALFSEWRHCHITIFKRWMTYKPILILDLFQSLFFFSIQLSLTKFLHGSFIKLISTKTVKT